MYSNVGIGERLIVVFSLLVMKILLMFHMMKYQDQGNPFAVIATAGFVLFQKKYSNKIRNPALPLNILLVSYL